jgi:hypothetical protein
MLVLMREEELLLKSAQNVISVVARPGDDILRRGYSSSMACDFGLRK